MGAKAARASSHVWQDRGSGPDAGRAGGELLTGGGARHGLMRIAPTLAAPKERIDTPACPLDARACMWALKSAAEKNTIVRTDIRLESSNLKKNIEFNTDDFFMRDCGGPQSQSNLA